jgi:1-acyl-sn-glycerol-3-phosphate acyltransferase
MSDTFYRIVRGLGGHVFSLSGAAVVTGLENVPRSGACLIASNHTSPYDVPLLIHHVPRLLDFVSIVEVFRYPAVGWFYGNMNAFALDRHKPDVPTVRTIMNRLERGRVVVMFPEGGFRRGEASVLRGGKLRPGIGRLVNVAGVPLVPAVVINSAAYAKVRAWLPLRGTRYAIAIGEAISNEHAPDEIEARLVAAMVRLYEKAGAALPESCRAV